MLLLKIFFFMHHFGAKIPNKVFIPQKKTSCHVFKMGIFSKLFVAVMAHIIMENADKKIKLLIICFQLKIMDILLSFFLWASLQILGSWFFKINITHRRYLTSLFEMLHDLIKLNCAIFKQHFQKDNNQLLIKT